MKPVVRTLGLISVLLPFILTLFFFATGVIDF